MSSRKKATITTCEKCKCTTLVKDSKHHADLCSSVPDNWEMSLIKPRCLMKGFAVQLENLEEYLPPNAGGWLRRHSVLIHPQAMEILEVTARQPVRIVTPSYDCIGVIWPCKELGVLRLSLSEESPPREKLISVIPIWSPLHLQRISVSLETIPHRVNDSLKDYIQMYLTNAYVQPGLVIPISYYGKVIRVIPEVPLDISVKNMSLEDGELESEPVVFLAADCTVSISISSSESTLLKDHISALLSIGGMHTAKKTLLDFVLTPFLNEGTCCSLLLWGLPGSGKTLLLSTVAKILGGSAYYFQIEIDVPMEKERLEILRSLTEAFSDDILVEMSKRTHGFTGGDLKSLIIVSHFIEAHNDTERLELARRRVRPTGIRQFILEVPHVSWEDIGGCEELKLEIQQAVTWPQQHRESFERLGIDPPSGILLYGPPGCSKTLVARALASESRMNFLAVKGPELFSKWVGESEKAIRDLFSRARQVAPAIIFFDEIDAVGSSRGSEKSSGVSDRVLAQLLTELDGLEKHSDILLLAATNRPDQLDSALLRPGRLDRAIYVGLPCPATRRAIIKMRTKRMLLAGDDIVERLVDRTGGYSGAEIVAVCRHAALLAMRENIATTAVQWSHFDETLTSIVPRTDKKMLEIYERFKRGVV
ncbi:unnamed protein product [Angiostrongylus costaricensis]|uniref:AAA domain-containing protein n=1 Tax=Angiostrongylus costaricensis TaxID=334426 RepID=A0A0R3PCA2_ANGCS|nr:unnamed protein product [Angiostrongylus costaricensis]